MTTIGRTTSTPERLTARQQEVLELLRRGYTNEEIAQRLGISLDGAKWHVAEIIGRLGVRDRYEAARWRAEGEARPWWSLVWLRELRWGSAASAASLVVIIVVAIGVAALAWGVWRAATDDGAVPDTSLGRSAEVPSDTLVALTADGTVSVNTETGVVQEIISGLAATPLAISLDGTRIAFACDRDLVPIQPNGAGNNLCAFDAATSAATMVVAASELPVGWALTEETEVTEETAETEEAFPGYAAWSPDGSKLAFSAYELPYSREPWDWTAAVYIKDLRSGELRRVSDAPRDLSEWGLSWSADGSRFSIVEASEGLTWIRIVDTATGTSWTLPKSQRVYNVALSPDGSEIAINSGYYVEIVSTVDKSSWPPRVFGWTPLYDRPDWSPDGERILVDGRLAARDGREWHRVNADLGRSAVWSPDGKRIAFIGGPDDHLYVTDSSGADPREVVRVGPLDFPAPSRGAAAADRPHYPLVWSGDGERLLYTGLPVCVGDDCGDPVSLFMVPLDGSAPARELFRHPVIDILGQ